jgi:hypothetical protein
MSTVARDSTGVPFDAFNLSAGAARGMNLAVGVEQKTVALGDAGQGTQTAVLITCESATWVKSGAAPTATIDPTACTLLAPGISYYFTVGRGHKISALLHTGSPDSVISITEFVA